MSEMQFEQVKNEVSQVIQNVLGDKLRNVILYGSYARGDYCEESDMDIMVLADVNNNEAYPYKKELRKITSQIALKNDVMVSVFLINKQFFDDHISILPFYQNVINDGVELYDN